MSGGRINSDSDSDSCVAFPECKVLIIKKKTEFGFVEVENTN
jgi:hypothetical protein